MLPILCRKIKLLNEVDNNIMKFIFTILTIILVLIGLLFGKETQIEWTTYLGICMVIVFGSTGLAFLIKKFEAIIGGIILAAFWPILWESFQTATSTLR